MFTGFATENSPAIQVWDYFRGPTSGVSRIGLTDDCAPIQLFRTGTTASLLVYLPTCPVEGKIIKIVNQRWAGFAQNLDIFSSDQSITQRIYTLGPGATADFIYSKNLSSASLSGGLYVGGWTTLNFSGGSSGSTNSVALGSVSSASGNNAFAVGLNNSAGAGSAVALGELSSSSSTYAAVLGGVGNTSNAGASTIVGGYYGNARSIDGNVIFPASTVPISFTQGSQQAGLLILGRQTTNATPAVLRSNTSSTGGTANQLILPNNSAYVFQGTVIANVTGGGDTSGWRFEGTIKRGANAASTTLVAAVTPTVISQDAGASAWVVAVTADTTNGGLAVTVTGAAATTIRWVCRLESTEVTF